MWRDVNDGYTRKLYTVSIFPVTWYLSKIKSGGWRRLLSQKCSFKGINQLILKPTNTHQPHFATLCQPANTRFLSLPFQTPQKSCLLVISFLPGRLPWTSPQVAHWNCSYQAHQWSLNFSIQRSNINPHPPWKARSIWHSRYHTSLHLASRTWRFSLCSSCWSPSHRLSPGASPLATHSFRAFAQSLAASITICMPRTPKFTPQVWTCPQYSTHISTRLLDISFWIRKKPTRMETWS